MVVVLSLATNQAAALRTMFLVLAGLVLITLTLAMIIPYSAKQRRLEAVREQEAANLGQ